MFAPDSKPDFGFTRGDIIIVTGAGSGIGRATAFRAAQMGLVVAAWDIDHVSANATVRQIEENGGRALAVTCDVSEVEDVRAGLAMTGELGEVRHLVNNAGPASTTNLEFEDALRISAGSMQRVTDVWLTNGTSQGASLVNIVSVAGNIIGTGSAWYSAAKAAIMGYTRHLAAYRSDEVRSNAVAPGLTDTPRTAGFAVSETGKRVLGRIPMGRVGHPDDIAYAALFLLSPLAGYINGAFLPVDGGWTITQ